MTPMEQEQCEEALAIETEAHEETASALKLAEHDRDQARAELEACKKREAAMQDCLDVAYSTYKALLETSPPGSDEWQLYVRLIMDIHDVVGPNDCEDYIRKDGVRPLVEALKKSYHALNWSVPMEAETCEGTVSCDQSGEWKEEAMEAILTAQEHARKLGL